MTIAGKSGGYQLTGDSFKASAVIKNNGTKDYDDNLIFELTPIDVDAEGYYSIVGEPVDQLIPVVLAAGEQTTINVSFSGLVPHQWYMLDLYYYSKTDNGYIVWGADDYCVTGEATAITPPAVLHPCSITYYSVDGKRLDKPEKGLNIIRMSDGTIRKVVVR